MPKTTLALTAAVTLALSGAAMAQAPTPGGAGQGNVNKSGAVGGPGQGSLEQSGSARPGATTGSTAAHRAGTPGVPAGSGTAPSAR